MKVRPHSGIILELIKNFNLKSNNNRRVEKQCCGICFRNKILAIGLAVVFTIIILSGILAAFLFARSFGRDYTIILKNIFAYFFFMLTGNKYGSSCTSTPDCETLSSLGLICSEGNCTCLKQAYFDGSICGKLIILFTL